LWKIQTTMETTCWEWPKRLSKIGNYYKSNGRKDVRRPEWRSDQLESSRPNPCVQKKQEIVCDQAFQTLQTKCLLITCHFTRKLLPCSSYRMKTWLYIPAAYKENYEKCKHNITITEVTSGLT
jgi:hypothetical protein